MELKNAIYAQSGGVTSVINISACAVIETARANKDKIGKVFAAKNGILGVIKDELWDTANLSQETIDILKYTPAGYFGSCRHKLKTDEEYQKILETFEKYNIGYFFYNGGGDSQDTANKIAKISAEKGYPVSCIGIPKTIDNDLAFTDCCPGFGSVAKYIAISTLEASLDLASMAFSSTKVFILEVMGRHAGWIAASSVLAQKNKNMPPHLILLPEVEFNPERFLNAVNRYVSEKGYCVVVSSEGIRDKNNNFVSESGLKDAFGHAQLGGVAPVLSNLVKDNLKFKCHWAVSDYLQRSARHIASKVDVEHAYSLGRASVELALQGEHSIMPIIKRISNEPYKWVIDKVSLDEVANKEKKIPDNFIREDLMGVTDACIEYLKPLIQGEAYPPYKNGIPEYYVDNMQ